MGSTDKVSLWPNEFDLSLEHAGGILSNVIRNVDLRREGRTEDAGGESVVNGGQLRSRK